VQLSFLNTLFLLITFLIGIKRFPVGKAPGSQLAKRAFLTFIGISLLFDSVSIFTSLNGIHNFWIFKVFLIVEVLFFQFYFKDFFGQMERVNRVLNILFVLILSFIGLSYVKEGFDSWYLIVLIVYFIIRSGLALIITFLHNEIHPLKSSIFWISLGRLVYYVLVLFIFIAPIIEKKIWSNTIFVLTFDGTIMGANFLRYLSYNRSYYVPFR